MPPAYRRCMHSTLDLLKLKLLLQRLEEVSSIHLHPLIIREAESSYALAQATGFGLLLFPCLFAERTAAALEMDQRVRERYWHQLAATPRERLAVQVLA